MDQPLKGRVAVVTGAGVRLGRAIALGLGARGAKVVLHCHASRAGAEEAAREIRALGAEAVVVQADLTQHAEVAPLFAAADALGGCDLLVNSAAIFERKPLEEIDDESWRRMLDANLTAPFSCCRAAVGTMRKKPGSCIVNILDVGGGLVPWREGAHYCAAKAGLAMLTRCLALELAPHIRVNGVAPGTVLFPEGYGEEERERVVSRIPLGRVGTPQDVVEAVAYLATAPFVTGQILAVDGGRAGA
jgi:pteridine reductase